VGFRSVFAVGVRVTAYVHGWVELDEFWVETEGDIDLDGFFDKSDVRRGYSEIRYTFHTKTDSPKEQVEQFIAYLERQCPVGDSLANPVNLKLEKIVIEE